MFSLLPLPTRSVVLRFAGLTLSLALGSLAPAQQFVDPDLAFAAQQQQAQGFQPMGMPGINQAGFGQGGFGQPGFGDPNAFGAMPGLPGLGDTGLPGLGAISEPPALIGSLGLLTDTTTGVGGTTVPVTGIVENFVFLFRDDPDMGIVREIYTQDEAREQIERELGRLAALRSAPREGQAPTQVGVADRASVEWDFYFEQLQMWHEFVTKKVVPGIPDLSAPTYDPSVFLGGIIDERNRLRDEFNRASLALQTQLTQQNLRFYERLEMREDRRRNFLEWIEEQREELVNWAEAWKQYKEGGNFRAGNPVGRDAWYAKTNFGNPNPMEVSVSGQRAIVSKQAMETDANTLNIISGNLTPFDLLDPLGRPRRPGQSPPSAPSPGRLAIDGNNLGF